MNSWKIILATTVIFGAGAMTGGFVVSNVEHAHARSFHRPEWRWSSNGVTNQTAHPVEMPRPRQPDLLNTDFVKRLDAELQLTPDQRDSIGKIIAEGQERNHAIWTNNAAQMRTVMQDVRHRVREALNPDQQKQFDVLMKRAPRRPANVTNAQAVLQPATTPALVTNAPGA